MVTVLRERVVLLKADDPDVRGGRVVQSNVRVSRPSADGGGQPSVTQNTDDLRVSAGLFDRCRHTAGDGGLCTVQSGRQVVGIGAVSGGGAAAVGIGLQLLQNVVEGVVEVQIGVMPTWTVWPLIVV